MISADAGDASVQRPTARARAVPSPGIVVRVIGIIPVVAGSGGTGMEHAIRCEDRPIEGENPPWRRRDEGLTSFAVRSDAALNHPACLNVFVAYGARGGGAVCSSHSRRCAGVI